MLERVPRMHARLAATATIALLTSTIPARADGFDPGDLDKQAHIAVSYGLTLTVATILRRYEVPRWQAVVIAAAATLVVGTTKELIDDTYSWGDQLANGIGTSSAAVVVFTFRL